MKNSYVIFALITFVGIAVTLYFVNKKADEKIQAVKDSTGNINKLAGDVNIALVKAKDIGQALGIKI